MSSSPAVLASLPAGRSGAFRPTPRRRNCRALRRWSRTREIRGIRHQSGIRHQTGHRHRRTGVPGRRPGPQEHPKTCSPGSRTWRTETSYTITGLPPARAAQTSSSDDQRPLDDREPVAPGPGRHRRRGHLPPPGPIPKPHVMATMQPGHQHPAPDRPRQYRRRRRPAAHRPRPHTRVPPAHTSAVTVSNRDNATTLLKCLPQMLAVAPRIWPSSHSYPDWLNPIRKGSQSVDPHRAEPLGC
jgi:hypothetical protein